MSRIKLLSLTLALMLVLIAGVCPALAQTADSTTDASDAPEANYNLVPVTEGTFSRPVQNVGELHFPSSANIVYEGQQGIFQGFVVKRGAFVQAGDVIGTVLVEGSDVAYTNAQLSLQRSQEAYTEGCLSYEESIRQAYDALAAITDSYEKEMQNLRIRTLESQYALYRYQQEHNIAQQQEALDELVPDNTLLEITAPATGYIERLEPIRDETIINDGRHMGLIYCLDSVLVSVPNESGSFRYGMEVEINAGSKNNPLVYKGTVIAADNVLPQSQRTGMAYIAVDVDPSTLDIETVLKLNITVKGESVTIQNVALLPRNAVVMENGDHYVTLYEDGILKKRFVLVADSNTDVSWIVAGLNIGDLVVDD